MRAGRLLVALLLASPAAYAASGVYFTQTAPAAARCNAAAEDGRGAIVYDSGTNDGLWVCQYPAGAGGWARVTVGGSTGATDNAVLRADGTGGTTAQASVLTVADTTGNLTGPSGGFSIFGGTGANDDLTLDGSAGTAGNVTISEAGLLTAADLEVTAAHVTVGGKMVMVAQFGEITATADSGSAIVTPAVTVSGTYVEVAPTTSLSAGASDFDQSANGRLRYTGAMTQMFHCASTISYKGGSAAADTLGITFADNGTPIAGATTFDAATSANMESTALHAAIELAQNEYVSVFVTNLSDTDDPAVHSLNIFCMAAGM